MYHILKQLSIKWCTSYTHVRRDADETNADIQRRSQQVSISGIHMLVYRTVTSIGLECLRSYMRRGRRSVSTTRRASHTLAPLLLHSVLTWTVGTFATQIHHDVDWNWTSETALMCVTLGWSCSSQAEKRSHCIQERADNEAEFLELIVVSTVNDNNSASWDVTHRSDLRAVSTTPQIQYTTRQLYTNRLAKPNLHRLTPPCPFPMSSRASPCC